MERSFGRDDVRGSVSHLRLVRYPVVSLQPWLDQQDIFC